MKRTKKRNDGWPRRITVGRVTITAYRNKLPSGNFRYRVDNRALTGRFDSYTTEEETLEAMSRLATRLESQETNAAKLTDSQAVEYIRAVEVLLPFNLTVGGASELLAQVLKKVGDVSKLHDALSFYTTHHRRITNITVAEMVTKLLDFRKARGVGDRQLADLRSRLRSFEKGFVCNIGEVTTPMIQTWLDSREFDSQFTYKNYRANLNNLFNYAHKQECCLVNPVEKIERAYIEHGEPEIYSPDEITKLLNACTPDFLPCLAVGAFAGLRSAEIERLEWSCLHWEHKEFFLNRKITKTGYPRTVPIQDNLLAWLADFKSAKGKVWRGTHDAYYDTQQEIAKLAGIQWKKNGLRHSFGTYRFRALEGDVTKVSAEMGNSRAMVENHYKRLIPANDATLYFSVKPEAPGNVVSLAAEG